MTSNFTSKITLTGKNIFYNELQVKHLKTIYKCLLGENLSPESIFTNLDNILLEITSLNKKQLNNLSFLDYFLLLIEIRCTSIGNLIYIEPQDKQNTKIEINLNKFVDILNKLENKQKQTLKINDTKIYYTYPSIKNLLNLTFNDYLYCYFLKKIIVNDKTINLETLTEIEKNKIIEQLSVKITSNIFKTINNLTDELNQINLLSTTFGLEDKFLPFNLDLQNLANLVKILFGEQLMTLYENIFMLCKIGNFTPEYIESCSPGEYILFVKKLDALINQQNSQENTFNDNFNPINNDLV